MKRIASRGVLRRAVTAVLVSGLLVGTGSVLASCGSESATGSSSGTGTSAVSDTGAAGAPQFSGVTLDGDIVTLDQFRGKPLLLVYMTSS